MKFGDVLERSKLKQWQYNYLKYNDIKKIIKENTSSSDEPRPADSPPDDLEERVYRQLVAQHDHIALFLKCKTGESKWKLGQLYKHAEQLGCAGSAKKSASSTVSNVKSYSELYTQACLLDENLHALSDYQATQLQGFDKLLKKYRKWTGSCGLEQRFQPEVLDQPDSITFYDITPLLASMGELRGLISQSALSTAASSYYADTANPKATKQAENGPQVGKCQQGPVPSTAPKRKGRTTSSKKSVRTQSQSSAAAAAAQPVRYWNEYDEEAQDRFEPYYISFAPKSPSAPSSFRRLLLGFHHLLPTSFMAKIFSASSSEATAPLSEHPVADQNSASSPTLTSGSGSLASSERYGTFGEGQHSPKTSVSKRYFPFYPFLSRSPSSSIYPEDPAHMEMFQTSNRAALPDRQVDLRLCLHFALFAATAVQMPVNALASGKHKKQGIVRIGVGVGVATNFLFIAIAAFCFVRVKSTYGWCYNLLLAGYIAATTVGTVAALLSMIL